MSASLRLFKFSVTEVGCFSGFELKRDDALLRSRESVFSEDDNIRVSSLKLSTLSSINPNCLLIRLVRGVILSGKSDFDRVETKRSTFEEVLVSRL